MDWAVLLPVIVSAGVIILLYSIPPPWVKRYLGAVDDVKSLLTPTALGDAVHHAAMKDDAALLTILGEEANGIVHDAIPVFTERLANEAVGLVASMYSKGIASEMGKKSGAARGYLQLPGIQKQAVRAGAESLLGGGLGQLLPPELAGVITPEMLQGFMSSLLTPGGNGQQAHAGSPQAPTAEWRPPV